MSTMHIPTGSVTITSGGSGYSTSPLTAGTISNSYLTSTGTYGTTWATTTTTSNPVITTSNNSNGITVKGDADFQGDVKIDGVSIVDTLKKIEQRLAILVPDPKKLEKYEALQKAYKHYKLLEALCTEDEQSNSK